MLNSFLLGDHALADRLFDVVMDRVFSGDLPEMVDLPEDEFSIEEELDLE